MEDSIKEPSSTVMVIAWLFIIGAGVVLWYTAMGAMSYGVQLSLNSRPLTWKAVLPPPFGEGTAVILYLFLYAVFQVAASAFVVLAGWYFRARKPWARTALEVVSWVCLLLVGGYAVRWIVFARSYQNLPISVTVLLTPIPFLGIILGKFGLGVLAVGFGVVLCFLHSKSLREEFGLGKGC